MECKEIKNRLSAYLDREVSTSERAAIEAHLKGCSRCTEEMHSLSTTLAFIDQWHVESCPQDLCRGIHPRVAARQKPRAAQPSFLSIVPLLQYAVAFFLGAVVGICGLGLTGSKPDRMIEDPPREKAFSKLQIEKFDELPKGSLGETYLALLTKKK